MRRDLPGSIVTTTVLVLVLTLAAPIAATAQGIPGPRQSPLVAPLATSALAIDSAPTPKTHWVRGAVIGGSITTAAWLIAAALTTHDCEYSSCIALTIAVTPAAFLLGAIPGALIGGQFPREPEAPAHIAGSTTSRSTFP